MRRYVQRFISCLLVLSMILSFGVVAQAEGDAAQPLSDINQSYAKSEIEALVSAGVLSGYEDGSFQPAKLVTRAELAKILVLALGLKVDEGSASSTSFKDVAASSWYANYVDALVKSGITQGTSENEFSPDANVTREELVVFLTRVLGLDKLTLSTMSKEDFADIKEVSDWAKNAVILASEIHLVNGEDGPNGEPLFAPKRFADRQAIARLAYEVKEHRDAYISKSKELANGVQTMKVTKIEAVSSTSVEVTFDKDLEALDKADFSFDKSLKVEQAAYKSGSKSVIVLTTSSQNSGTEYQLTFRGQPIALVVKGMGGFFGGGGAPGPSSPTPSPSPGTSVAQKLASGNAFDTITVSDPGSYGPSSGQTTVGTLILDPGPSGEVTLTNIHADNLQVKSGAVSSIKLSRSTITMLVVNAINNNGQSVRILALDGAVVTSTSVESQVILESATTTGTLGAITIQPGAAGKTISLRGNIDGSVTNNAGSAQLQIEAPSIGNSQPTVIHTINFGSGTPIVTVTGVVQIQQIVSNTPVTIKGDPDAVAKLLESYPAAVIDATVREAARAAAVAATIDVISNWKLDITDRNHLITQADKSIENAKRLGVTEAELNLATYTQAVNSIQQFQAQLENYHIQYYAEDSAQSVSVLPDFPAMNMPGQSNEWESDRPEILTTRGDFHRPASGSGDATVHLTLTIRDGAAAATKVFTLIVKQYDAAVYSVQSVRSDLLLVYFDHPVVQSQMEDFQIPNLPISRVTQYAYLQNYILLTVPPQAAGANYSMIYRGKAPVSFTGGTENLCTTTGCPMPNNPFQEFPLPDTQLPGIVFGVVFEFAKGVIPNATVRLIGTDKITQTDSAGQFRFEQVPSGVPYKLQITKEGYSSITTEEFALQSGEPYSSGMGFLYKKPNAAVGLSMQFTGSNTAILTWSPNDNFSNGDNKIEYVVKINGTEIARTQDPFANLTNLPVASELAISVEACNSLGCSEPVQTMLRTAMKLAIHSIQPLDSVPGQVYQALTTENGAMTFHLPISLTSADKLRIYLSDYDYHEGDLQKIKGELNGDDLNVSLVLPPFSTLDSELHVSDGAAYVDVALVRSTNLDNPVTVYGITGLKYKINGKVFLTDWLTFNIVPE
ncbi:S-layer homology domain-containing protein [Paenibacillus oryzisoli]|uniref:S-layer homology domain-containing protein n=1 Tax=Paenibacillus oryzisoli TaxID=1850517 RepID=UPI003D26ACE5